MTWPRHRQALTLRPRKRLGLDGGRAAAASRSALRPRRLARRLAGSAVGGGFSRASAAAWRRLRPRGAPAALRRSSASRGRARSAPARDLFSRCAGPWPRWQAGHAVALLALGLDPFLEAAPLARPASCRPGATQVGARPSRLGRPRPDGSAARRTAGARRPALRRRSRRIGHCASQQLRAAERVDRRRGLRSSLRAGAGQALQGAQQRG